jgi:hypothetical protein
VIVELLVAMGMILIGLWLMRDGERICDQVCWLDDLLAHLLPREYESFTGGLPWIVVGAVLMAHTLRSRR